MPLLKELFPPKAIWKTSLLSILEIGSNLEFLVLEAVCCHLIPDFSFRPLLWEDLSGYWYQVFSKVPRVEFCVPPYSEFYQSDR